MGMANLRAGRLARQRDTQVSDEVGREPVPGSSKVFVIMKRGNLARRL